MLDYTDALREDSNCYSAFYIASTALLSLFAGIVDMSMSRLLWRAVLLAVLPLLPIVGCQLAFRAMMLKDAALGKKICLFVLKTAIVIGCDVLCFFMVAFFGMDCINGTIVVLAMVLPCVSALLVLLSFGGEIAAMVKAEREKRIPPFCA